MDTTRSDAITVSLSRLGVARTGNPGSGAGGPQQPVSAGIAPNGAFLGTWGELGFNRTPGTFIGPSGVAVDADGIVYVASRDNRVQLFTPTGAYSTVRKTCHASLRSASRLVTSVVAANEMLRLRAQHDTKWARRCSWESSGVPAAATGNSSTPATWRWPRTTGRSPSWTAPTTASRSFA